MRQEEPYNRFQYHKFKWRSYHTEAFHIYFPYGYDSLCKYVVNELPDAKEVVKHRMATGLLKTPKVIIYPSVNKFYESNIGLFETDSKTLPTFTIKGNRLVLFFDGDHEHLKEQLHESLVRSIWEKQLQQNKLSGIKGYDEKIPGWFSEGAIKYFAHKWSVSAEDNLKMSFIERDFYNWYEVIAYQPKLAGQAFCYFLTDQFYKEAMLQLYGQLRQKGDLRRSVRLIAKKELDELLQQCFQFYNNRFAEEKGKYKKEFDDSTTTAQFSMIPKKKGSLRKLWTAPNEQSVVYVVYKNNKRIVCRYNKQTKSTTLLTKYNLPPWIDDYSKDQYPLLSTAGSDNVLITLPFKKDITVTNYSIKGNELAKQNILGVDGITGISSQSNFTFSLLAYRKGQSDIVQYNVSRQRYEPITQDVYDDIYLTKNIMETFYYLSSKPIDTNSSDTIKNPLRKGLYTTDQHGEVCLLGDTLNYINYSDLQTISNSEQLLAHTQYGTKRLGVFNATKNQLTTMSIYRPTEYIQPSQNIIQHKSRSDSITIKTQPYKSWLSHAISSDTTSKWLKDYHKRAAERAYEDSILQASKDDSYSFLDGVLLSENAKEEAQRIKDSVESSLSYNAKRTRPYILQLHSAYFTAQVNNDYFINRYQPYLNYQGQFKFPEVGGMVQGGFTDLFENHHISVGVRLPAGTEGSDFFVSYLNTAKKLDWGLTYFRKVEQLQADADRMWVNELGLTYPSLAKVKTHYYGLSLKYPITYYLSISLDQAFRYDRTLFLAVDKYSLTFEDIKSLWSITSLSVKQYKLKPTLPLLYKGYSAKLFIDAFKGFTQKEDGLYGFTMNTEFHQPLYKYITLVAKANAGYSRGNSYILYNLAGMDNNVTVRLDSNVLFPQNAPYAFQTLVAPMRGYLQNRVLGTQYLLFNADMYFPLFQSLFPIETALPSVNLLQLGLFTDVGTANEHWKNNPEPNSWLWSYGLSARTILAGYPIRFDIAWPGALNKQPVWYFSLSL